MDSPAAARSNETAGGEEGGGEARGLLEAISDAASAGELVNEAKDNLAEIGKERRCPFDMPDLFIFHFSEVVRSRMQGC